MMTTAIIPVLVAIFLTPPAGEESRLFWATYKSNQSTDSARIEAIHGLSSRPTLAGAKVLGRLLLVASESHRIEAARALTKFRGMKRASVLVAWALQHRANRKRTAVRVELVKTLGSLRVAILGCDPRVLQKSGSQFNVKLTCGRSFRSPVLISC